MKKIHLMIALLLVAFSTATLANTLVRHENTENTELKVISKKHPAKFDLIYVSEVEGPVTVEIFNKDGELVASDQIKNRKSFIKTYDFTKLGAGTYMIKVTNKEGETEQTVNYNPNRQSLEMAYSTKIKGKINITVDGVDTSKPVIINLYDDKGTLLKTEELTVTRDFTRTYNVKEIDSKSFAISASNGQESVTKYIDL